MASVLDRDGKLYIKFKDARGKVVREVTAHTSKKLAQRDADARELECERQRKGLHLELPSDGGETVADLVRWWLATYSEGAAGHAANVSHAKHIIGCEGKPDARPPRPPRAPASFAASPVYRFRFGELNAFLNAKRKEGLSPQSVKHIRRTLFSAFARAREVERFVGENPVAKTKPPKVKKTTADDYLREPEVDPVLGALALKERPLFATAIYEGMRKKELLTLQKGDVDLAGMQIRIAPSKHTQEAKWIPIHRDAVKWLAEAIRTSPSSLVFPGVDGKARRHDVDLCEIFRRALARAGIVTGYTHKCRKHGCKHIEPAADAAPRKCPRHDVKLWPVPSVRPIRFHDLRHTAATLMLRAGGGLIAVQKLLRHTDPKITAETYGHMEQEWVRETMNRVDLHLTIQPGEAAICACGTGAACPSHPAQLAAVAGDLGPLEVQASEPGTERGAARMRNRNESRPFAAVRDEGVEPTTFGSGGDLRPSLPVGVASHRSQPVAIPRGRSERAVPPSSALSVRGQVLGPNRVQARPALALVPVRALSVGEVAARLGVSPATVYRLCDAGGLVHFRVSNSIRVEPAELEAFIAAQR